MINGTYNALQAVFVYFFWVETRGMTLEAIDSLFEGFRSTSEKSEIKVEEKIFVKE